MVSIIVPIYNVAEYIEDCIQSVLHQTYTDWELILIDDCGTDNSILIAKDILKENHQSKFLKHDKNRGLSAARNTGLKIAKGEYVLYLDSDDRLAGNCLEKLVHKAKQTDADITIGDVLVDGNSSWIPKLHLEGSPYISSLLTAEGHDNILCSYINGDFYVMAWNKLIKRTFLQEHNIIFVEGLIHEDNPWSLMIACYAKTVAFVKDKTYIYVVRENSLQTSKNYMKHFNAYLDILCVIGNLISNIKFDHNSAFSSKSKEILINWFEKNKAIFYAQTVENGTQKQLSTMYAVIRKNCPNAALTNARFHYYLPEFLGHKVYRKFLGYNLL